MFGRWVNILTLCACALAFGVILPGHQRGCAGGVSLALLKPSCEARPACHPARDQSTAPDKPAKPATCFVCDLTASLPQALPPVQPSPPALLAIVASGVSYQAVCGGHFLAYHGRAPPLA